MGIPVRGTEHLREALSVVLRAPLWDVVGAHRYGIYYVDHPTAAGTFLPAGEGDRWLYGFECDPTVERIDDYTSDRLIERIRPPPVAPSWMSAWGISEHSRLPRPWPTGSGTDPCSSWAMLPTG